MIDLANNGEQDAALSRAEGEAIRIIATMAPKITFASHQNDIPAILDLVVENGTGADLEDVSLSVSAEPEVLGARTWTFDRIAAGGQGRPRDRNVPLAGGLLDRLTDRLRADVKFTLQHRGEILAQTSTAVMALARNEWGGSRYMPELLAAFVSPNDPAVQRFLKKASGVLSASGKDGSLEGYQRKSRSRVWEIMSGIWAAVSVRGLTYAVPPASFETTGQKIRLPSEIEETGLATCLDTAVLFAAAFEQAGLHPVIVFTKDHALAGAWLQPQYFPTLTVDDPVTVRKAVALDELVIFETTMATTDHPLPFSKAIAEGKRQLSETNDDRFIYAIDIRQARRRGIQPLSSLASPALAAEGEQSAERVVPPLDAIPDLPPFDPPEEMDEAEKTPEERLDVWRRSLLDLSKRNRLLNLRPSASAIPIFCPDTGGLEDLIAEGKRIRIIPAPPRRDPVGEADATLFRLRTGDDWSTTVAREALERGEIVANTNEQSLERGCIELYRKAKADLEEGGSNTLFLALGMLRWSPSAESKSRYSAPLILLPVRMERASARSKPYLLRHDDDTVFNLTLMQMLRQDFNIDMSELSGELPRDQSGIDVDRIWTIVRHKVKDVPGFEVAEEVILSTFSFAKYLMWKDLSDRTDTLRASPFVRHLIDTPRDPYVGGASFMAPREIDRRVKPDEVFAPLNADSSQLVAIHASGAEGDFVLEGPPGTGKSETIGNIIAHNLALGRKVLFVSEKMAALEVVYRRLVDAGLGDFCLELHSSKANKKGVLDQLDAAWTRRGEHSPVEWNEIAHRLEDIRSRLNGLVEALHGPGPAGISPRDAIGRVLRYDDVHRVDLDWPRGQGPVGLAPSPEAFADLCAAAEELGQAFSQITPEDMEALARIDHPDWSNAWQRTLVDASRHLSAACSGVLAARSDLLLHLGIAEASTTVAEALALGALVARLPDCARANLGFALSAETRATLERLGALAEELGGYRKALPRLSNSFPEEKISGQPIDRWRAELAEAEARRWPFRGTALKRLRGAMAEAFGIASVQLTEPERDLDILEQLGAFRARITELEADLPAGTPWRGMKTDLAALARDLEAGVALRAAVQRLAGEGRDVVSLRSALARSLCEGRDMLEPGGATDRAATRFTQALAAFEASLAQYAAAAGQTEAALSARTITDLAADLKKLGEFERRLNPWCQWLVAKRAANAKGLATLVTAMEEGALKSNEAAEAFRTAYCRWVAPELVDERPELNRFSAVGHRGLIATFRELDAKLAALTAGHIRARLSGLIPGRNALNADPGFGVLSRQLQRTVGHLPVRQLVTQMGSALASLTPCLMMSPLSVAQFLPADLALFDLVVFDEASQITVPDAIGAIGRGRRAIVVGDPRQMPPTRFFEKGAEDDENDDARDLESILDEALAARIPLHRLTGHYRSRHESLIAFSNHAYYKGELVTFPSADTRDTAVSLRKVDGIYAKGQSRTNPVEAQAVVAAAVAHLLDPVRRKLSLGIVTLNAEQQRLIEDLLDAERRKRPDLETFFRADAPEPVFVKNLETVQGDQRDVILISVCYGPTEPGAATMSMNFGPLNRKGGERRLNVAITRATSEVLIFTSFPPSMIDLTRTQSDAVRDLKHYLEFAERGPTALGSAIRSVSNTDYDSDFEMAVAEGLRQKGWVVRTQIGVSKFRIDLGIVNPDDPGNFLAGVECDGATYHSSPTARDRDRVRHIILERLGWRLCRIWSTDWFLDPASRLNALDAELHAILAERREQAAEAERKRRAHEAAEGTAEMPMATPATEDRPYVSEDEPGPEAESVAATPDGVASGEIVRASASAEVPNGEQVGLFAGRPDAVEPAADKATPDPAAFHEPNYRGRLRAMAQHLIDAEGPITFKRVSDLIAREHGFQKTGSRISSTIWDAVNDVRPRVREVDGSDVFWPEGARPLSVCDFRGLSMAGRDRQWREVPLPEQLGLLRRIQDEQPEDLARRIAEAIGYGRVTQSFRDEIAQLEGILAATEPDA